MNRKTNRNAIINGLFNRQINKIIVMLALLSIVFIMKTMNNSTSKEVLNFLNRNINRDFVFKEDSKWLIEGVKKLADLSKIGVEHLKPWGIPRF
ncbi:MAG: hypothetical protein M0Q14_05210 [Tissierellaceae bacterium]|nr:hypothetical protein [Tissierellaceae bacterium]